VSETAAPAVAPVAAPPAPAAPPVAPAPPAAEKPAPVLSPEQQARASASLAQREMALREQQRKQVAERDALKAKIEKAERMERIEALAKSDPTAILKEFGLDYGALTKAQIAANPEGTVKRSDLDALVKKINEEREAEKRAASEAAEKQRAEQERLAVERQYLAMHKSVSDVIAGSDAAKDEFEELHYAYDLTGAPDPETLVLNYIGLDYERQVKSGEKNPTALDPRKAAEAVNAKLAERLAARDKLKKYAPKSVEAPKDAKAPVAAPPPKAEAKDAVTPPPASKPKGEKPVPMPGEQPMDFLQRYQEWAASNA